MKQAVAQFTNKQLTDDQISILNLSPNFLPTHKKLRLWTLLQQLNQPYWIQKTEIKELVLNLYTKWQVAF